MRKMDNAQAMMRKLQRGRYTLVVDSGNAVRDYEGHGLTALHHLLATAPRLLDGAAVGDKVIGKGAAALMVLGHVRCVIGLVVSRPALELLQRNGISVTCIDLVPHIMGAGKTGMCPLEELCADIDTADRMKPIIDRFVEQQQGQPQ